MLASLQEEHCRIHQQVFEALSSKLVAAVSKAKSVQSGTAGPSSVMSITGSVKYIFLRGALDETISDLEKWQRIFDPTWFLILRIENAVVDSALKDANAPASSVPSTSTTIATARKLRRALDHGTQTQLHVSLPEDGLDWDGALPITHSNTRIVRRAKPEGSSAGFFAVDTILCDSTYDVTAVRADAESLAKKLKQVDPDIFALPSCHGVVKRRDKASGRLSSIELIFRIPLNSKALELPPVRSLRYHLSQPRTFSLTRILDIARQLASAVSFVHTCNFVHKNIRPESILVFPDPDSGAVLGSAYTMGFDSFRSVNFHTLRNGDAAWHRNLYRHPQRQGLLAYNSYVMQHDIYSLGVCLLELGLWESFVCYPIEEEGDETEAQPVPSVALGLDIEGLKFSLSLDGKASPTTSVKDRLVNLARSKLPLTVGDRFAHVVITCLTCLDEENVEFSSVEEMHDEDGVIIGTKFIEKVLFKLNEISL